MRIITVNVNGIRAAAKKGFFDWLKGQDADVVCLQETKAQEHQLTDSLFYLSPRSPTRPSGRRATAATTSTPSVRAIAAWACTRAASPTR